MVKRKQESKRRGCPFIVAKWKWHKKMGIKLKLKEL